uniref:Uncharacterized protein n=1 Tax=Ditylenchus dipsaci TaxID=166011 RepID=A0A915ER24_9BILA
MTADIAVTLNSDILSSETPQPSTSTSAKKGKEKPPPEYCVLLVGTHHKQPLFEKLLSASDKFERHIQYQDTFYLYVNIQGKPAVVELNDPALSIQVPERWLCARLKL